jgi:hypothetical protein
METINRQQTLKPYNINTLVNANAVSMADGSKWILWGLARLKEGLPIRNLNTIADILESHR